MVEDRGKEDEKRNKGGRKKGGRKGGGKEEEWRGQGGGKVERREQG